MCTGSLGAFASKLPHARLKEFFEYWKSKCRGAALPALADIDPVEIPQHLAALSLVDVVRENKDSMRFRYRLIGSDVMDMHRANNTGKWLDEVLVKDNGAAILRNMEHVAASGEPHVWRSQMPIKGREHIRYTRLLCPLASDGKTVDALVAVFVFDDAAPELPAGA